MERLLSWKLCNPLLLKLLDGRALFGKKSNKVCSDPGPKADGRGPYCFLPVVHPGWISFEGEALDHDDGLYSPDEQRLWNCSARHLVILWHNIPAVLSLVANGL